MKENGRRSIVGESSYHGRNNETSEMPELPVEKEKKRQRRLVKCDVGRGATLLMRGGDSWQGAEKNYCDAAPDYLSLGRFGSAGRGGRGRRVPRSRDSHGRTSLYYSCLVKYIHENQFLNLDFCMLDYNNLRCCLIK